MTFYLLTWTYFIDFNGGRNILIDSQLLKEVGDINSSSSDMRKTVQKQSSGGVLQLIL